MGDPQRFGFYPNPPQSGQNVYVTFDFSGLPDSVQSVEVTIEFNPGQDVKVTIDRPEDGRPNGITGALGVPSPCLTMKLSGPHSQSRETEVGNP